MQDQTKQNRLITVLTLVALVAMISAFFAPIWWVSLTAPNYPKDAFRMASVFTFTLMS
jgi:ABC-type enterobactin transport system permease subunit